MTKTTVIAVLAVLILTTSMTVTAFATVSGGYSDKGFSIIAPPAEVGNDDQQATFGDTVLAFDEKQGHVLISPLHVDFFATDNSAGDIPAGTIVSSTMIVYDPVSYVPSTGEGAVEGCVTFEESVIGIQFLDPTLIAGDSVVGLDTVSYSPVNYRGIEVPPHSNGDQVWFSTANSICFDLVASSPGDTFRVITEGDHNTIVLWQVGVFDQNFRDMSLGEDYGGPYNADNNPTNDCGGIPSDDCVDPDFPGILGAKSHSSGVQWTDSVTINFESPSCSEAMLLYSRAGVENDEVIFDGNSLGVVSSLEGVYDRFDFDIGSLTAGSHSVTINYLGGNNTPDDLHAVDAIALVCWEPKVPPTEIIEIDVKPGSDPSSWNCKNTKGSMPVAVFGSAVFDVETIDLTSLVFAYDGTEVSVEEVHNEIHIEDKNGDEFQDAVLHLDSAGVCEATNDAPLKQTVDVTLTGDYGDGLSFDGLGDIRIVKR
jgi:hypothetical protein